MEQTSSKPLIWAIVIAAIVLLVASGAWAYLRNAADTESAGSTTVSETVVADEMPVTEIGKEPAQRTLPVSSGAGFAQESDKIRVVSPNGGETLEIGKTYDVTWENYLGKEDLLIALIVTSTNGQAYTKIIAGGVPAAASGAYKWTVTSEDTANNYRIEVYPAGSREYVGRSLSSFKVSGSPVIVVDSPAPNARVDLGKPVAVAGKARGIFGEGEFDIRVSYFPDGKRQVISQTLARRVPGERGDNWMSGEFVDFTATLDLSKSPVCNVNVEFFKRDDMRKQQNPLYILPLWLYGNENCLEG
ncbi:MAG TPA: Ser-Thr-rich GPI-anchored membrane family protein [Candidatus Paceibacterota bacterium]